MQTLFLDYESFSTYDLKKVGAHKYCECPEFELIIKGYAFDDGPVLTDGFDKAWLFDPNILKVAHNAFFECTASEAAFDQRIDIRQWRCTMVQALSLGLPASLMALGKAMRLPESVAKLETGTSLISFFCKPCKPTKKNGGKTRNLPEEHPEKWAQFVEYCCHDIMACRWIWNLLNGAFPMLDKEWESWFLDWKINRRGVKLDMDLVRAAVKRKDELASIALNKIGELTGLDNPKSPVQLKRWLTEEFRRVEPKAAEIDCIDKEAMADLIAWAKKLGLGVVVEVLELRQGSEKASVAKFDTMIRSVCADGTAKGNLQFYGASRTGRWAGRNIQLHNLHRNNLEGLEEKRQGVATASIHDLSELVRTAIIPAEPDEVLLQTDLAAIEAVGIAWLAGEEWVLDIFRPTGSGKLYESVAASMFGVDPATIVKGQENYALRSKGKVSTLACGYSGGVNALIAMGALTSGIPEKELPDIVTRWRNANQKITALWYKIEEAVRQALRRPGWAFTVNGKLKIWQERNFVFIELPSGRKLAYLGMKEGEDGLEFEAPNKAGDMVRTRTYSGKLAENCTQALCRDILNDALRRLDAEGFNIQVHIHDEVVASGYPEQTDKFCATMIAPPDWGLDIPIRGEAETMMYYRKG